MPAEICYMWHIYFKKYRLYKKDVMYRILNVQNYERQLQIV